jgi:hypothetical protein
MLNVAVQYSVERRIPPVNVVSVLQQLCSLNFEYPGWTIYSILLTSLWLVPTVSPYPHKPNSWSLNMGYSRLLYRPTRRHRLAGRYNNPMPESTISPRQGLRIWLLFVLLGRLYRWDGGTKKAGRQKPCWVSFLNFLLLSGKKSVLLHW